MEIIKVNKNNFDEAVNKAVEVLVSGGVVVVPTDTVYGLAADAGNKKTVRKVFEIKDRAKDKKLPVFVSSFEMLDKIADVRDVRVKKFLRNAWPGKITCALQKCTSGMHFRSAQDGKVAVRMPNCELVLSIIEKFGGPITGTSADMTGKPEHTKIDELIAEFNGLRVQPDLILDAGDLPPSKPSIVLDCTVWPPKILREGAVSEAELKKLLAGNILK